MQYLLQSSQIMCRIEKKCTMKNWIIILLAAWTGLMSISPSTYVSASSTTADTPAISSSSSSIEEIESVNSKYDEMISQKVEALKSLRNQIESKLEAYEKADGDLKKNLRDLKSLLPSQNSGEDVSEGGHRHSLDHVYDEMEKLSMKLLDVNRREGNLMTKRVALFNRMALTGTLDESEPGLEVRLNAVLTEEVNRRDRYQALVAEMKQQAEMEEVEEDSTFNDTELESNFISLNELENLLDPTKIVEHSEQSLKAHFATLSSQVMKQHMKEDEAKWNDHFVRMNRYYENELAKFESSVEKETCSEISDALKMIEKALYEYYYDVGVNLVDLSSIENGGSVVYSLTSGAYVPPVRNNGDKHGEMSRADKQIEQMYFDQKLLENHALYGDEQGILFKVTDFVNRFDSHDFFISFRFGNLKPYLPDDWERILNSVSDWDDNTPRGVIDSWIPDYVYHSLGFSNIRVFGSVVGRTVSPEVAISSGGSVIGGVSANKGGSPRIGGETSKPLGNCYPLSMRPEDDPIVHLLSNRNSHLSGIIENGVTHKGGLPHSKMLLGPKYTVRLPNPVYIDAVTLEHRPFPVTNGIAGEYSRQSAPRWFRVVGFPPCPNVRKNVIDGEEDECGVRGFDFSRPIDLGSFEYKPVRIFDGEDNNGEDEDDMTSTRSMARQRSIQTFTVKGGHLKTYSGLNDVEVISTKSHPNRSESSDDLYEESDQTQCSLDSISCDSTQAPVEESPSAGAGQCSFPSDEDEEPSCGDEVASERHLVEVVSFIIDENWGNADFTCLYRVRVHGDIIGMQ
mmetsp:Transcript_17397/g.36269  ORF Transcript_17397/g.36269 Transcript_17397/m.36269 type:complete len:795 (-) Transcript_17397:54-2438(-)